MKLSHALIVSLALGGCIVDDEDAELRGDVAVAVVDGRGSPVPGARVFTEPASRIEDLTDAFGIVSIRGIEAATYDVYADFEGARARTVLGVDPDRLASTQLQLPIVLPGGGNEDGSPRVFITSPEQTRTYAAAEAIEFDATASDDVTPGDQLLLRWTSNRDGELGSGAGDANGRLVFDEVLSSGFHQLTLTVRDGDGDETERKWSVFVGE